MRRITALVSAALLLTASVAPASAAPTAELYSVTVTRLMRNVYREQTTRLLILTRACYQYVYGEDAILEYEQGERLGRLYFRDGDACDVTGIYRPNATLERIGDDLYRDIYTRYVYRTWACYVYAYTETALILSDRIIFVDSRDECDRA